MAQPHKVFYKGQENDFVVFVDNPTLLEKYHKGDNTIPLIDIVSIYKVFVNRQGGVEGILDEASKQELQSEFGDKANVDDVIKAILKQGSDKQAAGTFDEQKPV